MYAKKERAPVIRLSGEWSADSAALVADQLTGLAKLTKGAVTLDLSAVDYMDSAGLSTVVAACARARSAGLAVSLCNVTPSVAQLIELCRLSAVFSRCETSAASLEA
ncbi:MAG: STAS domain-containing protein [Chromatiales bacterium]|nr:STAS domain-containing protein [Chromatiales bacterium]